MPAFNHQNDFLFEFERGHKARAYEPTCKQRPSSSPWKKSRFLKSRIESEWCGLGIGNAQGLAYRREGFSQVIKERN